MVTIAPSRGAACVLVVFLGFSTQLLAQPSQAAWQARAKHLTQSLASLGAQHKGAADDERAGLARQIRSEAAERHELLAAAMTADPAFVLEVALPDAIRDTLPADVRDAVEQQVDLEGTLEVLSEDYTWGARIRHYLRTSNGRRFLMSYADEAPAHHTGDKVRARGVLLDNTLALKSSGTTVTAVLPLASGTTGEQRTLVILVNFLDNPSQPYTAAYAHDVVFTTTSDFDREASFQRTWLTGDVVGWFPIALSGGVCNYTTLASLADSAAIAAGVSLSSYTRKVYAFPQNACGWWGLGTVGGSPSQAWINGDFVLPVVAHEMGHNLGLNHAHSLDCGPSVIDQPCTTSEYGDTVDTMGGGARGHFSAFNKERLGWLGDASSPPIVTVSTTGTYALEPFETPSGGGAKALKILKSTNLTTGARTWYYVEFRQPIGFDDLFSGSSNLTNGVVVHTASESSMNSQNLLDMTPETDSFYDPALVVGASFSDPAAGVTLTPLSASSAGATVAVTLNGAPCTRGTPTVSLSPSQSQWLLAGATATYMVSVTSTDSSTCSTSSVDLTSAVPAGWTASLTSPSLTMAPGATASTTMRVTSAPGTADGFYTVSASATHTADRAKSGGASATYVVMSALGVQVSSAQATYYRNQTVRLTAGATGGSAAAAGATIVFTVTKPTGAVTTKSVTADSNGTATYSWKVTAKEPAGTYQVRATATLNTASGSGTTTFAVTK